jgi:DNA-binding transcriptional regulator LsrR (DeoR family)
MPRPRSVPDLYLLSKVSTLYYDRDQTQQEIAERLRLSRPMVSRLLQEAREQGIVQITIAPPRGLHIELETLLEDRFGLQTVQVVPTEAGRGTEHLRRRIGAAAAAYLARTLRPRETIGMSWGATLSAMVQAMAPLPSTGVRVVQTLGGVGPPDAEAYAAQLVRRLAQLLGAGAVLLPAPGIVATPAVRDVLRDDPHVRAALRELDSLDTVFVGLGALATNPVLNDGHSLARGTRAELLKAGAVGDIALRFFDAQGTPVRTSLDERILGITTAQLRKVPRVVAVAGGPEKADAIFAGLAAGIVNVLITDQTTAEALAAHRT